MYGHDALVELSVTYGEEPQLLARAPGGLDLTPGQEAWMTAAGAARAWIGSQTPSGARRAA